MEKNIIIDGLNVHYLQSDSFNSNEAIIFLHGWGASASVFNCLLKKCGNFIAVDLPGFGGSEFPPKAWNLSDYALFIGEFLKKMDVKNPILIGHSFGGSISIKYLSSQNDAKKLILIDSAGIREKTLRKFAYKIIAKIIKTILIIFPEKLRQEVRNKFYKTIDAEDYIQSGAMKETFLKIISEDLSADMKKILVETVLIWGENDKDTPVTFAEKIKNLIKNSRLFIIKNSKHYPFLENPEEFNQIFFKEIC